jgi:Ca2+-binding RTX toxin-like protein
MSSRLRSVAFALAVTVAALSCAWVSIASAGTVTVVDGTAIYAAAPGEANQVRVESDYGTGCSIGNLCIGDLTLTAGAGCNRAGDGWAICPEDDPDAVDGHRPVRVYAGDGDDGVGEESGRRHVTLYGGTGNDSLGSGSYLGKSPVMYGGPGADSLYVNNNGGGNPILHGGRGDDEVKTHCGGGVCGQLYGDAGDDLLAAFYEADWLDGGPGRDVYAAGFVPFDKQFADLIAPSPGIDTFDGSYFDSCCPSKFRIDLRGCSGCVERVIGSDTENAIIGNADRQVIWGEGGDDVIRGRGGIDHLLGGDARDRISARDDVVDYVSCGAMEDTVIADPVDVVRPDCEHIRLG